MIAQALWSECPVDGQPRMLARCRRLYRPQVRPFIHVFSYNLNASVM